MSRRCLGNISLFYVSLLVEFAVTVIPRVNYSDQYMWNHCYQDFDEFIH
jgi:hypothetical protein